MNDYKDRGMIKWQPFDSLTNFKKMKIDLQRKKNKKEMPILSEDQLVNIENIIKEAYFNKNKIKIYYYLNGAILNKEVKIKNIDYYKKQIILSDNTNIYYKQIINVKNV